MAIEIVDLPMKNGGSFHSYVSLPEGRISFRLVFCGIKHTCATCAVVGMVDDGSASEKSRLKTSFS